MDNDNKVIYDDIQIMLEKLNGFVGYKGSDKFDKLFKEMHLTQCMYIVFVNNFKRDFFLPLDQHMDIINLLIEIDDDFLDKFYSDDAELSINQKISFLDDKTLDKYIKHLTKELEELLEEICDYYHYEQLY